MVEESIRVISITEVSYSVSTGVWRIRYLRQLDDKWRAHGSYTVLRVGIVQAEGRSVEWRRIDSMGGGQVCR